MEDVIHFEEREEFVARDSIPTKLNSPFLIEQLQISDKSGYQNLGYVSNGVICTINVTCFTHESTKDKMTTIRRRKTIAKSNFVLLLDNIFLVAKQNLFLASRP